ncbi:STAS domain-containing protein [Georgenia sp. EYE_87]|uniref:STAS domain-containing protein n=1 Tax=Georgenia sp. EYE_87 TaxID=2853448 RepID=UPI002002DD89|nr:STAS domain-containing protein [Georgenia sp. EYE_87]MCK6210110.1 STAS domain-containing protein [Georgenia sp. EYE_87]
MADYSPLPEHELGTVALILTKTHVRLALAGELDLATKAELLEAVREAARHDRPVEVDARHVTFMDSSAIAALSRLVQLTDHRPIFISPPDVVRFLLDVTRIGELVDIVDHDGASLATTAGEPTSVSTASS